MDLLFKNYLYFFRVYFNFSVFDFLVTLAFCIVLLLSVELIVGGICTDKKMNLIEWIQFLAFSVYISTVICITILNKDRVGTRLLRLNPFPVINGILGEMRSHILRETISNMIMFFPLGLFVAVRYKMLPASIIALLAFACSVAIEVAQFCLYRGTTETLDVICNVIGAMCGVFTLRGIMSILQRSKVLSGRKRCMGKNT